MLHDVSFNDSHCAHGESCHQPMCDSSCSLLIRSVFMLDSVNRFHCLRVIPSQSLLINLTGLPNLRSRSSHSQQIDQFFSSETDLLQQPILPWPFLRKPFDICMSWAWRVLDEFFDQGDEENAFVSKQAYWEPQQTGFVRYPVTHDLSYGKSHWWAK